jgi:squalene-hopene/tetraprenyl-beta-curcumene cyclase
MWAFRPLRKLPPEHQIDELFLKTPAELPVTMAEATVVDDLKQKSWVSWKGVFRRLDLALKWVERLGLKPLRKIAIRKANAWILERLEESDGLGAIFPPIVWTLVILKAQGYADDHPLVLGQLEELDKLSIREGDTLRLEPCRSPVWDTAIATIALRESGVPAAHPALRRSVQWLLDRETKVLGDWAVRHGFQETGGWYFEFRNQFYPDVDDTIMVMIALSRVLPEQELRRWQAEFVVGTPRQADPAQGAVSAVWGGQAQSKDEALADLQTLSPMLGAISRGMRWVSDMQNRDGGWGAFDRDNDREIYTQVPFADHNAMIDPSSPDLAGRVLEAFGKWGRGIGTAAVDRGVDYLRRSQRADGSWFGRWGVNYIYGTWQAIEGLRSVGVAAHDPAVHDAVDWLVRHQQPCGGWGETPESYTDPRLAGHGVPTASQTAWAVAGLVAAGRGDLPAARRGVQWLLSRQRSDGGWDETEFTGTGFPKVFYLRYHYYPIYFPLMALARHAQAAATCRGGRERVA